MPGLCCKYSPLRRNVELTRLTIDHLIFSDQDASVEHLPHIFLCLASSRVKVLKCQKDRSRRSRKVHRSRQSPDQRRRLGTQGLWAVQEWFEYRQLGRTYKD